MTFAIKAKVTDLLAETFAFSAQKTMYGGKHVAKGDVIFVFASENEGGPRSDRERHRHFRQIDRKETRDPPANAAREHHYQTYRAREAALSGEANSSAFAIGTTVDPKLSLILNSIVRQRTRSPVSRMKQRHSSTDSFKAAFGDYSQTASPHA